MCGEGAELGGDIGFGFEDEIVLNLGRIVEFIVVGCYLDRFGIDGPWVVGAAIEGLLVGAVTAVKGIGRVESSIDGDIGNVHDVVLPGQSRILNDSIACCVASKHVASTRLAPNFGCAQFRSRKKITQNAKRGKYETAKSRRRASIKVN